MISLKKCVIGSTSIPSSTNRYDSMNTLLLIDVQKDFHHGGSLAIPGADEDAQRIVQFIQTNTSDLHRIVVTFDSHSQLHIAHPYFWIDVNQNHPQPFTIISSRDIRHGIWTPRPDMKMNNDMLDVSILRNGTECNSNNSSSSKTSNDGIVDESTGEINMIQYCIEYTRRLEEGDQKFQLCIWPEHCLMGSGGHTLVDSVFDAIHTWTEQTGRNVEYIYKGQNLYTEMYSALAAEVPISIDTSFNTTLHQSLLMSNRLIVAGQALSHCVNYTVRDIVQNRPSVSDTSTTQIVLLEDCTSSVPGFAQAAHQFLSDMKDAGVRIVKSTDFSLSDKSENI
jgi:nicotinamidase/pyrazinamidase